jgi:hypothetical protein
MGENNMNQHEQQLRQTEAARLTAHKIYLTRALAAAEQRMPERAPALQAQIETTEAQIRALASAPIHEAKERILATLEQQAYAAIADREVRTAIESHEGDKDDPQTILAVVAAERAKREAAEAETRLAGQIEIEASKDKTSTDTRLEWLTS